MADERRDRLWSLFRRALDLDPARRAAFLADECPLDEGLRREVAERLASHESSPRTLDNPETVELKPRDQGDLAGERVGPYAVRERIGEGGMGVVYLAEQQAPVRRRIALKVLRPGHSDNVAARFALERQALAVMNHPNIARVYDAGVLDDGRPFLAMELVAGVPLGEYCDRHGLDVRARIELFLPVCHAIQHAHQKGVIHRDIKPSNLLVSVEDGVPTPKVIDFGVAKAIHPGLAGEEHHTLHDTVLGTPEYMSPEQLDPSGLDVDTRSDIYSLGVVLYLLLSGALPFDWRGARDSGLAAMRRLARESQAGRASRRLASLDRGDADGVASRRRTTPEALGRALAGDLDWILLRALEVDRTRRYASASELAADLRHYLAGEPVSAGPPGAAYRLRKFVMRHRLGVITGAAGLVLLASFAVSTALQSAQVSRALARADRERARAERVSQLLIDVFQASDPIEGPGRDVTAREVLDRGAERVIRDLSGEPEVQAGVMSAVGRVYGRLRMYPSAARLLGQTLDLRRRLHPGDDLGTAEALEDLGTVLRDQGDLASAASLIAEAGDMRRRLHGEGHPQLASALYLLGSVRRLEGNLDAARELLQQALVLGGDTADAGFPGRAPVLEELGTVEWRRGDLATAEEDLRAALALRRRDQGADAPRTAQTLSKLGALLEEKGDSAAAEELQRAALLILEGRLGPDHGDLAAPLNNLAWLLHQKGDYAAAEPLYSRSLEITRRVQGGTHANVAIKLNNLGELLLDQGRLDDAARRFREALAVQGQALREGHPDLAYPMTNLAAALRAQGRLSEAEASYRRGLAIRDAALPAGHPARADSLAGLGELLVQRGAAGEAEPLLRQALELRRAAYPDRDWRRAEAQSLLGGCLSVLGRREEAERLLLESVPILEGEHGRGRQRALRALEDLAGLYQAWGRPADAGRYRQELERQRRGAPLG